MLKTISHYRIHGRVGGGGMGEVYKAEDLNLKRPVALKLLSPRLATGEPAKQRLLAEARAAAALNHPNIATIYEVGEAAGQPFIAMELVEGETLDQLVDRRALDLSRTIEVAIQIAEALKAAHTAGLIHCDVKSANVALTREGQVKLLDCGLARLASGPASDLSYSAIGLGADGLTVKKEDLFASDDQSFSGTLSYSSPEQIKGEPLDNRTDLFSFGVVLYEMLTGKRPFDGDSRASTARSILNDEPARVGRYRDDIPLEMESVVRRSLEKSRDDRYATAEELLRDLKQLSRAVISAAIEANDSALQSSTQAGTSPVGETGVWQIVAARIWRYRRWFTAAAALSAIAGLLTLVVKGGINVAGVALIAAAVVCVVAYIAARNGRARPVYVSPPGEAFRGLLPFQESDRHRFFGRESDTLALFEKMTHADLRFGVLFGDSGAGKTSLVKAGLIPRLWEAGLVPIYCRSYKDPLAAVVEECRRHSGMQTIDGEPTVEYMERVTAALDGPLVIVFDQFEEFFVNFRLKRDREPFVSFVAGCLEANRLGVKFLFSMRSDFLYLINSEFARRVEEPLATGKIYHLKNFDQEQAEEIIEKSARKAGLRLEPGLTRLVARDLAVGDAVLPSELQIVGERLQSRRIFTVEEYNRAGGKEPLVHSFLQEVVEASGDREACGLLLRSLISDENTRLTLTLADIEERTQRGGETVERLVNLFVSARLLRVVQDDDPWRYELMHEYLIEKINQITGRVMDATQRANRVFRQYLSSYSVDRRTRIPVTKLWAIRQYSDIERGERERELLRKSLRLGILKSGAAALFVAVAAAAVAAALSITEKWDVTQLSDGHTATVRRAVISPDGTRLVSCGEDGKIIVWDFARRERIATLTDHGTWVCALDYSRDGKWFATGGMDGKVIVWDAARLEIAAVLRGFDTRVGGLAFSPDCKVLASSSGTGEHTTVWEVGRWTKLHDYPHGGNEHTGIMFSEDSRRLYLPGSQNVEGGQVRLALNVDTGGITIDKHDPLDGIWGEFSPDGKHMVIINTIGMVYFTDEETGTTLSSHRAHKDHGRAAAYSPDGSLAATGAEDIVLWDARTQTKLVRLEHTAVVWSLDFSPDGKWLVSTHSDGAILLWSVAERERVANFNEHSGMVRCVAYSKDAKRLASASEDQSIIIWNVETGQKEATLIGHNTRVTSVAFSPDGTWMASVDQDANLIVWDLAERLPRYKLGPQKHVAPVSYCVAISPDGRWIAHSHGVYRSSDGHLVVPTDGTGVSDVAIASPSQVYGMQFSPDGRFLAFTQLSGEIVLFDVDSWHVVDRVKVSANTFVSLSYSSDGKYLVTGSDEGKIELFATGPLRHLATIGQHPSRVRSVCFSPDGQEVASAGEDRTIGLWDVSRRQRITSIGSHNAPVISVAFSPDGKHLASGEHDKSVRIYTRRRMLWGYHLD